MPTVDFTYPDDGDEPAPRVRDDWRPAPLLEKCSKQRFACVPSGDVMTMPLLDKRLEVLRYALRRSRRADGHHRSFTSSPTKALATPSASRPSSSPRPRPACASGTVRS